MTQTAICPLVAIPLLSGIETSSHLLPMPPSSFSLVSAGLLGEDHISQPLLGFSVAVPAFVPAGCEHKSYVILQGLDFKLLSFNASPSPIYMQTSFNDANKESTPENEQSTKIKEIRVPE